jgi:hypothetical protein
MNGPEVSAFEQVGLLLRDNTTTQPGTTDRHSMIVSG